jgi:hypothetical protein
MWEHSSDDEHSIRYETERRFAVTGTFAVDADAVLQRQGANARKVRLRRPRLVALAEQAIAEGQSLIRPAVAYRILKIQKMKPALVIPTNGTELRVHGVARKLAGAELAIATIAPVGAEIERQILRATKHPRSRSPWMDMRRRPSVH